MAWLVLKVPVSVVMARGCAKDARGVLHPMAGSGCHGIGFAPSTPEKCCTPRLAGPAADPVRHLLRAVATDVASDYAAAALECANAAAAVEERT